MIDVHVRYVCFTMYFLFYRASVCNFESYMHNVLAGNWLFPRRQYCTLCVAIIFFKHITSQNAAFPTDAILFAWRNFVEK